MFHLSSQCDDILPINIQGAHHIRSFLTEASLTGLTVASAIQFSRNACICFDPACSSMSNMQFTRCLPMLLCVFMASRKGFWLLPFRITCLFNIGKSLEMLSSNTFLEG